MHFDLANKSKRIEELEREMEAPDFWDDVEISQQKMKTLKSLKDDLETYQELEMCYEDIETLVQMAEEENDASLLTEIEEAKNSYEKTYEGIRIKTLLSGEFDADAAIVSLNAGQVGPSPATGRPCSTACTPAGRTRRAFPWMCWIFTKAMRPVSNR